MPASKPVKTCMHSTYWSWWYCLKIKFKKKIPACRGEARRHCRCPTQTCSPVSPFLAQRKIIPFLLRMDPPPALLALLPRSLPTFLHLTPGPVYIPGSNLCFHLVRRPELPKFWMPSRPISKSLGANFGIIFFSQNLHNMTKKSCLFRYTNSLYKKGQEFRDR